MIDASEPQRKNANLRRREHHSVPKEWVQAEAERRGVPPGLEPKEVNRLPETDLGPLSAYLEYWWSWEIVTDPTDQTRQVWLADGPKAGEYRVIPAAIAVGERFAFPNFGYLDETDLAGELVPTVFQYRLEKRTDGLWFGRWQP